MKTCILLMTLSVGVNAQFNMLTNVPDDAKVATIDGHEYTAGQIREMLKVMPDQFIQQVYNSNQKYAVQQMFMMRFLAEEAEREKVGEEPDIKSQLEIARANILAGAMLSFVQNHFTPTKEAVAAYYQHNIGKYLQAKVRIVGVTFKASSGVGAATSPKSMEQQMKESLTAQVTAANRTQAEAILLAKEAAEKLRGGADFAKVFEAYSDDPALKASHGVAVIAQGAAQPSKGTKAAVFALKPGEVSDPLEQPSAYYVIVLDETSTQPQTAVELSIMDELRQAHMKEWFTDISKRFDPQVESTQFFSQPAPLAGAPAK